MLIKTEQTHEDNDWIYGRTLVRHSDNDEWQEYPGGWQKLKKSLWISKSPLKILSDHLNITTSPRRSTDLESFFDGDLNCWYYLHAASDDTEESIKWILGPIAAYLNETEKSFKEIRVTFPADYLKCFIEYQKNGKFDKGFSKEIFHEFLITGVQFTEESKRLTGNQSLDKIISNPKYKAVASDELDIIIDNIIAANSDQAIKAKDQPKVVQWFVGQVMKASKGKATGEVVLNKLKERLL